MKKFLLLPFLFISAISFSQTTVIDTLVMQDFDTVPTTPNPIWTFTGPVIYNMGTSSGTAAPPNSPIGIGASRAWETTTNSSGLILTFANVTVPNGYDSIRVRFNLAAMNLTGGTGGPDDLDYVLTEVSTDGGATYYNRLRIRGAIANNSFWPYSATGVAKVYYTPLAEALFQPTNSGLQTTEGYSICEIAFPGSVTQVQIRITGRSSSASDTWLVDNLLITGEFDTGNSVGEISTSNLISVYPNPSTGNVNMKTNVSGDLKIYNALGEEVYAELVSASSVFQINLPSGIYFWKVCTEGEIKGTGKIIVQ